MSVILLYNALPTGPNPPWYSAISMSGYPSRPIAPTPDITTAVPTPKASRRRPSEDHLCISPTVNDDSWTCTTISGFNESKGESGEWDRRSVMHDSLVTPGRTVPSRGGVMTSISKNPHEIPATEHAFHVHTISAFTSYHDEEVHASCLGDFHS